MPVFLFALSQTEVWRWRNILLAFFVLHFFIYPASNAYNSYMDKDEGSIGGLRNPPKVTVDVFYLSVLFDLLGLALSLTVSVAFFGCVLLYMLASRAYSYKGIRIKKYPLWGFLIVVFFQGAFTFLMSYQAFGNPVAIFSPTGYAATACLFLLGGVYPLTQVYQHEADSKNGDRTISIMLGYRGTFVFTAAMFTIASMLLFIYFSLTGKQAHFFILQAFLLPVVVYFIRWFMLVEKDRSKADFDHTMTMNALASSCMNACFVLLAFINHP